MEISLIGPWFCRKYFAARVPEAEIDPEIEKGLKELYQQIGSKIEKAELKSGLETIFSFIRSLNKYYDEQKPWITVKEDLISCQKQSIPVYRP